MTEQDRLAILEARMGTGEPFTYAGMCALVAQNGGNENADRLVDRTFQRWRRKGLATFTRIGRETAWTATNPAPGD